MEKRMNRTAVVFVLMIMGAVLGVSTVFAGGAGEMESAAGSTITITDQTEREVTVPVPARRIITIPIPAASMMIAIDGGPERLVGMHSKSKSALEEGILREFYPEALAIRSDVVGDGFVPNVETILSMDPDLVLQWGHLGVDVVQPLENAGINTALLLYGTQEYLEGWISTFGTVLGREDKADRIINWHHETRDLIEQEVAEIPEREKPRVLYFLRWLSGKRVAGSGTYNDYYIGLAGGVNPAAELSRFSEVSEEQIIAWDPEVILLNGFESELSPEDVYANERLADVSAVRNRRVYKIPLGGYRWDPPNQESPLMWKWLTMVFHPDRFDWELRNEIAEAYQWIYGHVPTSDQVDGILRTGMNADASGYARFEAE